MGLQWKKDKEDILIIIFLIIGFIIAITLVNPIFNALMLIITGFFAGREFQAKKSRKVIIIPYIYMVAGFILGFMLGSIWINRFLAIIIFVSSFGLSYYLHKNGYLA